jgi:hypothetical protein
MADGVPRVFKAFASEDAMMKVVFLSGDLIFASRVQGAAEAAGCTFQLAGRLPDAASDEPEVGWIILDLATRAGIVQEVAAEAPQRFPAARLIAYGPHVQVGRLKDAREAGVSEVLTRGQFSSQLPHLFERS